MAFSSALVPEVLTPGRERPEPGIEAMRRAAESRQEGVLEDRRRKDGVLLADERMDELLDRRAAACARVLPGLAPVGDLAATTRTFYGRRARWSRSATPAPGAFPAPEGSETRPHNG